MTRVMPKKMQIACVRRLFIFWNSWRVKENPEYDAGAEAYCFDFEGEIDENLHFDENLQALKRDFPEYTWSKADIPKNAIWKQNEMFEARLQEQIEKGKTQHEELFEVEKLQDISLPEEEEELRENVAAGTWKIEKTAFGETHTLELDIQLHKVTAKGKPYAYGRIQLTVPAEWAGLRAKISIDVPKL